MSVVINDKDLAKDLKDGCVNPLSLERYLLNNLSAPALAHELAMAMIDETKLTCKPVVVTKEQFASMFRIQGYRWQDGNLIPETRGNFSKRDK